MAIETTTIPSQVTTTINIDEAHIDTSINKIVQAYSDIASQLNVIAKDITNELTSNKKMYSGKIVTRLEKVATRAKKLATAADNRGKALQKQVNKDKAELLQVTDAAKWDDALESILNEADKIGLGTTTVASITAIRSSLSSNASSLGYDLNDYKNKEAVQTPEVTTPSEGSKEETSTFPKIDPSVEIKPGMTIPSEGGKVYADQGEGNMSAWYYDKETGTWKIAV